MSTSGIVAFLDMIGYVVVEDDSSGWLIRFQGVHKYEFNNSFRLDSLGFIKSHYDNWPLSTQVDSGSWDEPIPR